MPTTLRRQPRASALPSHRHRARPFTPAGLRQANTTSLSGVRRTPYAGLPRLTCLEPSCLYLLNDNFGDYDSLGYKLTDFLLLDLRYATLRANATA